MSILVIYLESRGLLEFHGLSTLKRLHAVKVPKNGQLMQSINFSVSPPTSTVLLSLPSKTPHPRRSGHFRKIYKLTLDPELVQSDLCSLDRRGTDCWIRRRTECIVFCSDFEFLFDGTRSDRVSVFGRESVNDSDGNAVYQWFVAVTKCDGDVCIGMQCGDSWNVDGDFCDGVSGWGYHCDGFLKNNASFTRFGWKYGERDTIGVILRVSDKGKLLQFALNGRVCTESAIEMPRCEGAFRLAVSVGLNSIAQLLLVGFAKT